MWQTKNPKILVALFAVILLALTVFVYIATRNAPAKTFDKEFALALIVYAGNKVHLYSYKGKPVVVYAWASWCTYCADELKNLSNLKNKYGQQIEILAINRGEPLPVAKGYTDALQDVSGLLFLIDPTDSYFKSIGGYAMPETVFIDIHGAVRLHQHGPMKIEDADQEIAALLK